MAKIAVELQKAVARRTIEGGAGRTTTRWLARGEGWEVGDVICTSGPDDRPFEERRSSVAIALVTAGTFQYRSAAGRELMTPGSLMLGNAGESFECGHEHGLGDRCLSFHYDPDYFKGLAADAAGGSLARPARDARPGFRPLRLPPLRAMSPLVARACAGLIGSVNVSWEELSVQMAARTVQLAGGFTPGPGAVSPAATARVTRAVRRIERDPCDDLSLSELAREARLSPYHFLRTFQRLTGVTPHQYVMRTRLREAAVRLAAEPGRVAEVAFDSGFGDVSNFNHAFRAEFGTSPRVYRQIARTMTSGEVEIATGASRAASRAGGARRDGGRRPARIALLAGALLVATAGCHHGGVTSRPDPPPASSLPLPTGARLDPAAPSFRVGNMPLAMVPAPAPAGRFVLLLSGWREQCVQVVDTVDRRVLQTLPQPGALLGLAFSADGNTLYASGGDDDSVWRYDWKDGAATFRDRLVLAEKEPGKAGRRYPAGLALSRDGTRLYVAENLAGSLAVVDTTRRQVVESLPVGRFPYGVAVASDGTVWVSAWGENTIVSFVPDGDGGLEESGRVEVGRHPSALLLNADSTRLFVASASTDRIAVVDTGARRVIGFLHDPTAADTIEGSTPNALALSADGRRLFVAEADNNAVAVFDLSAATAGRADAAGEDRLAGRIPCEWYPTALAAAGGSLIVVNGKGRGTGPNPDGPRPGTPLQPDSRSYTLGQLNGTLTVLPEEWPAGALARMTRRVAQANGWDRTRRAGRYPPFKHVLYILKENRTYDQVLSDLPAGDGDPSLLFFPREVTPNHHALAERFGLFDRFFVNAEVSSQGHAWSTAGYVTDYGEKTTPSAYSDRREEEDVGDADQPAAGYLWHLARERGVSYRNYGEAMEKVTAADGTTRWQTELPGLMEISHPTYPGWDLTVSDQVRADLWIADLEESVARGSMPGLQFLWLPNDHTAGARPGLPTPSAFMADNDLALGRIIEALSGSPFWKDTVVFVLEDDAQSGPDHVDSHRSILMVISAYNRPGVVHRFVNTTDVLATIEEILGLRSLSQFDHFGRTLSDVFADTPDPTPYRTLKPSVPWTELNPPAPAGNASLARGGAPDAGVTIDLSTVDAVDDDLFNRVLWAAIKGSAPYPEPGRVPLLDRQRSR